MARGHWQRNRNPGGHAWASPCTQNSCPQGYDRRRGLGRSSPSPGGTSLAEAAEQQGGAITNLDQTAQDSGTEPSAAADSAQPLADPLAAFSQPIEADCGSLAPTVPPDVENVRLYVDNQLGWIFGVTTSYIVLNGTFCSDMKAGVTSTVQIVSGCEGDVPPQVMP